MLPKLRLNDDTFSSKATFFGRDNESNKLVRVLKYKQGSTTLISGDRGSGKTTTIHRSIERIISLRHDDRSKILKGFGALWAWTGIYTIAIEVPLLPNTTESSKIRETVLRLLVQTLVSDYRSKNLYQKLRLPVTYYKKLKEIENLLLYKKIVRKEDSKFSLTKYNSTLSLGKAFEYEVDLAYADIELLLKSFFLRFSHSTDFIIVFDELDKYEDGLSGDFTIKPHEYIKELKNLFTLTNAKFIFTSTESYYQELDEKSKANVLELGDYKFSLFTNKILINHLEPDAFSAYFDDMFSGGWNSIGSRRSLYYQLLYSMMWVSDLYPFAAKKLLSEIAYTDHDGSSFVNLTSASEDLRSYGNNISCIEYLITETYGQFSKENDEYFNRFLYKALKKVARVLYSGRVIQINKDNFYALIFDDMKFSSEEQKVGYFHRKFSPLDIPDPSYDKERWESLLAYRDNLVKNSIDLAVSRLIWYFDAIELIKTTRISEDVVRIVYVDDLFSLETTMKRFDNSKKDYRKLLRKSSSSYGLYLERVTNVEIKAMPELPTLLGNKDLPHSLKYSKEWNLFSIEREDYRALEAAHDTLRVKIAEKIMSDIKSSFPSDIQTIDDHTLHLSLGSEKFRILVSVHNKTISSALTSDPTYKIVCINPTTVRDSDLVKNTRLKYFYFETEDLKDYPLMMDDVNKYIIAKANNQSYTKVRVGKRKKSRTRA